MSTATIDFEKKEITLTIPYECAADMAMVIEVAQDASDKRAEKEMNTPEICIEGEV